MLNQLILGFKYLPFINSPVCQDGILIAAQRLLTIFLINIVFSWGLFSQDLYYEDFQLPSGTIVDNGPTGWTRDVTKANLGDNGFFETRILGNLSVFQAVDIDGEAIWISDAIDISAFSMVVASVDIAENGTLEGNDFIRLSYQLDGGTENIFGDFKNDFGNSFQSVISPVLSGSTLQLIIRVTNNEVSEEYLIDNVKVSSVSFNGITLYSRGNRQWDNQNTWSTSGFNGPSCHCTPNFTSNVIIGRDHTIRLNAIANVKSITIRDTGNIVANSLSNLFIEGDFINASSHADPIGPNVQSLTLNGATDQNLDINGESVFDLIVNKPSGIVRLQSQLNLLNYLDIQTPTQLVSNGNLKLISTSDEDFGNGSIGELRQGASVSGDVTVQRYMSGEGKIWRYISSPVSNATIADWQDDFRITGNFDDPSTGPGINPNSPSLYYYGESGSGANKQLGWTAYPTSGSAASNSIIPGTGYSALMLDGLNPIVVDITGTINQGDFAYNVSFAGSGWNLLGNPYPATVDWKNTNGWSRSNVANAIYVRNNENGNENSIIASFIDGIGTNGGTGLIATGQSFWVLAIGSNPSLIVNERAKGATTGVFFRNQAPANYFRITLRSATQSDEAVVRFNAAATLDFDPEMDAMKFSNGGINLSTQAHSRDEMAINSIPMPVNEQKLNLNLQKTKPGNFNLSFTELNRLDFPCRIKLIDNYSGSVTELADSSIYEFTVASGGETYENRFELLIQPQAPKIHELENKLIAYPNPATYLLNFKMPPIDNQEAEAMVYNSLGTSVLSFPIKTVNGQSSLDIARLKPGIYYLKVITGNQQYQLKFIKSL